jgi:hypothetical protein
MQASNADVRDAIVTVMNRYAHALDVRDWNLLTSLFTPDARFHGRQYGDYSVPGEDFMVLEGRDAIVGSLQTIWRGLSATHHMLSNHMAEPAPDHLSAKASCYLRAHHVGDRERAHLFEESLGRFDFEMVCAADGWKITRMDENIFVILGTADAFPPPDDPA